MSHNVIIKHLPVLKMAIANKWLNYLLSITNNTLPTLFIFLHIKYSQLISISALALLLTFLLYCLFFYSYYCIVELSFGGCNAQISPFAGLIKEFLIVILK